MREVNKCESWVVYLMTLNTKKPAMGAVCEQAEWDAMELAKPGYHKLIKSGITSEGEAEQLARGTSASVPASLPTAK
jgi:hypothetical protein